MNPRAEYDPVATIYAGGRWPLPWKAASLEQALAGAPEGPVLDVGCGTGDYLLALEALVPRRRFFGLDISPGMLAIARRRSPQVRLLLADARCAWPVRPRSMAAAYSVDVLHHLDHLDSYFREAARALDTDGRLILITDSEQDLEARSLARFFPETVAVNRGRYPTLPALCALARASSFDPVAEVPCDGHLALDDRLMAALSSKAMSELRELSDQAHSAGMQRVRAARERGESWLSRTTRLTFRRLPDAGRVARSRTH